jgi:hypothetical protein
VDAQTTMWCSVSTEDLVPADHPIRRIKPIVDAILARLEPTFNGSSQISGDGSVTVWGLEWRLAMPLRRRRAGLAVCSS